MNLIDKLYTEWAWRTKSGVPDIKNPEDKAILDSLILELVKEEDQEPKVITKKDIIDYINNAKLDDKQIVKLYQRVTNFGNYRSIKDTIRDKGYGEKIYKQYSTQIQNIIEDLPASDSKKFSEYLQNKEKHANFNTSPRSGKILDDLSNQTNLPNSIISAIFKHTAQDEKKRGVGMGELALTLLFKNIANAEGKGDLSINGQEFEIKGNGAKLGPDTGDAGMETFFNLFSKFGVTPGNKIKYNGTNYLLNQLPELLSALYKNEDKKEVLDAFKALMTAVGVDPTKRINKIDWSSPSSINMNVGLMNFIKYASEEGFSHFMLHDFGSTKLGGNTGEFVYASGSPEGMAEQISNIGVQFQRIGPRLLRPRIGITTNVGYLEEDEE